MYIERKEDKIIEHYKLSEIASIRLPDNLLKSFARSLVPEFQAYIQANVGDKNKNC